MISKLPHLGSGDDAGPRLRVRQDLEIEEIIGIIGLVTCLMKEEWCPVGTERCCPQPCKGDSKPQDDAREENVFGLGPMFCSPSHPHAMVGGFTPFQEPSGERGVLSCSRRSFC